jgi:molybdenum cofactor sulfurtransferase
VVELYGQWKSFANVLLRLDHLPGPTVAFNLHDLDGSPIGYDEVSRLASLNCPPIQLRTGCFCNPGACQDALPLTNSQVLKNYASGHICGDRRGVVNGIHTGAIRASFGKDSLWEDMDTLARFVERVFVSRGEARVPKDNPLEGGETSSEMNVTSLFVYPIKSCAAVKVKRWPVSWLMALWCLCYSDFCT